MLKNLADLFRGLFGRRHRKTDAASRRRQFLNQFRKGRMEGLEDRALMAVVPFTGTTYTQDFQSFTDTSLAPASIAVQQMNEISAQNGGGTVTGWYAYQGVATDAMRWGRSLGGDNSGGLYAMRDGVGGQGLGSISSGSDTMHWGVVLQNTSGSTINTVTLDYDAIINRNPSTTANPYALSYQVSTADVTTAAAQTGAGTFNNSNGTWTTTTLGFTTPSSGTGAPGTQTAITPLFKIADVTGNLSGLNWQNNEYLYIRFADGDDSGGDSLAGVDNFSVSLPVGNQTPVNTVPGAQVANQGSPLTFSTVNGNAISIADDSATVTLTLSSTSGNISLSGLTGLTGSGNGTNSLSYVGTPSDINAALQGLTYTSSTLGADTLVVTTNDGTLSDSDNVAITTYSMTPLAAGDLALIHFDTGGTPGDNFSFLVLKTLNAGTRFWISDNEITADGDSTFTDVGEAEALFVVNDGQSIPAGTVIKLRSDTPETTTAYTWAGGGGLGGSNEELYFYTSNNVTGQVPATFIYGAVVGSASARPAGLTTGTTFISIAATAAARYKTAGELYNASQALLLASIGDTVNNWESIAAGSTVNTTDWTFTVATGPEANVQGNAIDIASGDTTPSLGDNTDFGSANQGGAAVDRVFTIQNYGATDITLSGTPNAVTVSGGSNFSIQAQPSSTTITSGSSVTFTVRFTPTTVGTHTATISFANNDSNENPYTFDVTGTVTAVAAPEVDVQGNSVSIVDGDTTPDTADHTQFPSTFVGSSSTRTFAIFNTGSANLTLSNFQSTSGLFVIQNAPAGPIAPAGTATFDVVFSPTATGSATATISFTNNDSDEGTYNFDVSGTATAAPTALVVGDIAFTAFQADNTGGAEGDFYEFVALRDMTAGTTIYFVDGAYTDPNFATGENVMRWVAQTAVTAGTKFSFTSPAGNGTPSTAEWTGIDPVTGTPLATAAHGLSTSGESITAIINPTFGGTNLLTGTAIAAVYFGDLPATLPAGLTLGDNAVSLGSFDNGKYDSTVSGSVETGPQAVVRTSINTATNWVTSETPFSPATTDATFTIVNEPEINIQGGGLNIADGDTTPVTADGTDFGAAVVGGATVDRTFTIQNLGTQPLVLSGGPNYVTVTGGSNFSILTQPASGTITAGGSATFVVRMTPTTIATQTATVSIGSNDTDEAIYDFAVTSVVTASAAATTTALNTVTPLNAAAGDSITFAGTVVAGSGTATPIGTVEIRDGGASGTLLASTTTIGGTGVNGTFNIVTTTVPAGTYNSIQAFFVPGAGFQASNSAVFSGTLDVVAAATYVNYSNAGATYSQNFDTLINTGTVTLSGVGPFHLADPQFATTPITGWYFSKIGGSGSDAQFRVDDGNSFSGSIYSYGAAAASDRTLGTLSSGSTVSRFGAVIRNTTGSLLDTFTITFDGEQWRNGVGSSSAANVLDFEYAVGVAPGGTIDGSGFTGDSALDFTAPVATSTEGALDGNTAGLTAGITRTVSGLSWAPGTDLIIRWSDLNDTGNDDGLGIDNFTFSAATTAPNGSLSFSAPTYNVTENGVTATVTVNRVGNTAGAIGVTYSTVAGGTAVAGTDYTTTTGTLSWNAGDNAPQQFTIPITDNLTLNANKTINIALSNPTGGATLAGNTTGVVTIRENEQAPQVLLNELVVNPPTSNDRPWEFVEVRGTPSTTLGSYYVVQIDGGSTVPANAGNVWFLAELSNATMGSNGLLVVKAATGGHATTAPSTEVGSPLLDIANGRGLINTAQTTAIIFSPTGLSLDQDLDTNNDGTLDLPAGAVLVDSVGWKDNSDLNAGLYAGFVYGGAEIYNEPFPLAGSGTPDAATRIYNNDTPNTAAAWFGGDIQDTGDPSSLAYDPAKATANLPVGAVVSPSIPNSGLSVSPASGSLSQNEGSTGTTTYTFNISRAGDLSAAVDVTWTVTGSGTNPATAADFENGVFPTGLASFAINEATKQITINVVGDTDIEPTERFTVTLSNPTNGATLASPTTNATIVNDDFQTFVAGDIVLTGINSTNPDQFSFVPLVALQPFSTINFTDNAYDVNLLGFATNEGVVTYTAPAGGLAAGTKVVIQVDGSNVTVPTGGGTAALTEGSVGLSTSGENLFAFTGTLLLPTILFSLTTNTSYISTGTPTSNETYLPASLTIGTSAVAPFETTVSVNAQYTGPTTGTAAALQALVADEANWTTSGTVLTLSPTNFTISGPNQAPTDIDLAGTTIAENAGANATVGTFATTDPDAGNTFTYTLVPGTGSTGNAAFNISGNTLRATSSLDFETQNSYSIRVRTTDQGGAFFEEVFVITVTNVVEPLQVTSFTPTSSGFVATFSEAFNPAELNLYGNAALGVADVTLVGATTGTVRGSLILNAASNRIEFVRTQTGATASAASGILPNDTYTVTLRSAGGTTTDGFNTIGNVALDGGIGDTAPGGEYTTTFVVNNPAGAVRVSLPDFTRGHGQAVNVPNTSTGLPLYISTGQNVSSLQMTLTYDPALLSITGFTLNSALQTAGVQATPNFATPGVVTLDITHTTELSSTAGALTLGAFTATVPTTAPYGAKQVLDITSLTVFDNDPGIPQVRDSIGDDAVHVSAYFGDTSGNRQLQSNDGTLLARVNALLDTGFPAYQMADPTLIADISGNNQLQSNDGTLLARFNALISTPQIPAVPAAPVPLPSLAIDPVLAIGAPTTTPAAGSSFTVPLTLTVPASESAVGGVTSFGVLIEFDETKLTFVTNTGYSTVGTAAAGFGVTPNQIDNGATRTIVFDVQGGINQTVGINPGETIILGYLTFSIPVGVTGSIDLNLLGSYQTITTAVFDDSFSELFLTNGDGITPAPTNGFDPNNDLTINLGLGPNQAPTAVSVTPNPATIAENTAVPANLLVGTIGITDDGQGINTLSLVGADASSFTIVGNQIFLNAGTSLNFETKPSYTVSVQVDDTTVGSTPDATTIFTLNVTNVNEAPTVTPATFTLAENSANGTTVGTVTATDPDAGDTIATWAITGGNTGGAFAISNTGVITVANVTAVDFEANPTFSLSVTATDAGGQTSAAGTVTINLTDVFEAISPIYINEIFLNPQGNDSPNEFIELRGNPNATIPVGTYLVAIEGDSTGAGDVQNIFDLSNLTFGSNGLLLLLQKANTYDTSAAVTAGTNVVVNNGTGAGWGNNNIGAGNSSVGHSADSTATDLENASASFLVINTSVAPTLTDDIDAANNGTPGGVYANWTILDSVGLLDNSASPSDFGYAAIHFAQNVSFAASTTGPIVLIGEAEYVARIGNSTGSTAADWLGSDTTAVTSGVPPYNLTTSSTGISDPIYRGSPINHIGLPNNFTLVAPTDIALTSNVIPENSAPGSTIGQFSTTDPTVGDTHTYTLVAGTGSTDNAAFTLTTAGVLTINGSANFEAQPSYSIRVRSTDAAGTFVEKEFTISVTNVNEGPTDIQLSNVALAENAGANAVVGMLTGTDVDVPETLTFSLPAGVDNNSLFNISGNSLRANSSFDFEAGSSYQVTVRATDAGGLFYDEAFPIIITNVNEAPVFGLASYSFSLAENSATGAAVGSVSATDQDAGASLTYSLSGTGSSNFEINPTTGAITVAAGAVLNFEGTNTFNLTAGVTDGTNPVSVPVTISLTNVNEAPSIAPQTFSVSEQAAIGAAVGTVVAIDPDSGDTMTFAITAGNTGNAFAINPSTGAITVAATLDFNTTPVYTLTVSVTDAGLLSASNTVTINVTNVNSAPTINTQTFTVPENSANGTAVGTVVASDIDSGDILSYAITAGNTGNAFAINGSTGAITVANGSLLDFEGTSSYALTVTVNDNGIPVGSSSATITINLTNVNEAPTDINLSNSSIAENQPAGTTVGNLTTVDPDVGNTHTYALVAGTGATHNALFTIIGGELRTGIDFDFEAGNILSVRISSTDQGGLSFEKVFTITVTNFNEAPTIAPQTFSVAENAPNGTAVGTVVANDVDAGDTKTFAIIGGNPGLVFDIDVNTGVIYKNANATVLDFETTPSYSLTVSVTDGGGLSASNTVTINLTNVNEAPVVTPTTATIAENSANGSIVDQILANDPDLGDVLSYSLSGPGSANFSVDATGQITVANSAALDYETVVGHVFNLIGRATDVGGLFTEAPVTITLSDVNEAPSFNAASYTFQILDTIAAVGTNVGTVVATDPDAGATLSYSLSATGNGTPPGAFAINSTTGQITVNDPGQINFFTTPTYSLTASVSDGLNSVSVPVTVNITHTNQNPTFVSLSNNSVEENLPVGTVVGTFSSTDNDLPNDTHTYTLLTSGTGSTDHASFSIVGNELRTNAIFDYESKTSYTIRVRTTDQGAGSFERIFTIFVTNVAETGNQAPTNIALSGSQTVAPTGTTGTPVGTLSTTDPNPGNTFTYTLGGADAAKFQIDGAILRLASDVTDPVGTLYNISVTSTDQGGLFFTKNFAITVAVAPNVAPTFLTLSANSVPENSPVNTVVGQFATTDANPGDTFTYTLLTSGTGSTDHASFNIVGNQLRTSASFDYETKTSYTVRVRTTDQGGLAFERIFTIYVTNVVETGNQAPTNINLSSQTLAPAAAPGTTVGTLTTSDPNPGNTFTYTLGGADAANFVVNGNLLQVAPAAVIGPAGTTYSISVTSTDQGGLFFTKNFTINVAVTPNVAPTYLILSNNRIAENAGANALVGTLSTTDANASDTHTYSLVAGTGSTHNALFTIVGNELRAVGSFDYETKTSYNIRVRTTDQGGLSFERVLTIYVTNVPGA